MESNVLGLQPRTFNGQLEKVKIQKGYVFHLVKGNRTIADMDKKTVFVLAHTFLFL